MPAGAGRYVKRGIGDQSNSAVDALCANVMWCIRLRRVSANLLRSAGGHRTVLCPPFCTNALQNHSVFVQSQERQMIRGTRTVNGFSVQQSSRSGPVRSGRTHGAPRESRAGRCAQCRSAGLLNASSASLDLSTAAAAQT